MKRIKLASIIIAAAVSCALLASCGSKYEASAVKVGSAAAAGYLQGGKVGAGALAAAAIIEEKNAINVQP